MKLQYQQQRHEMERQQAALVEQMERLKLQATLDEAEARLQVLDDDEETKPFTIPPLLENVKAAQPSTQPLEPAGQQQSREPQQPTPTSTPQGPAVHQPPPEECSEVTTMMDILALPKPDVVKFNGDVTEYNQFKHALFDYRVGNKIMSSCEKLHYLYQFLEGMPKELVSSCMYCIQ